MIFRTCHLIMVVEILLTVRGETPGQRRVFAENDDCKYYVNNEPKVTFEEANSTCHDLGGSLAMMKTNTIQDFVETQVAKQYGANNPPVIELWIGGIKRSNSWYWLDDTSIPLTGDHAQWRWDSQYKANETYFIMSSFGKTRLSMKWYSKNNNDKKGVVCEVAKTDLCASLVCNNNGKCIAVGCQANCDCPLEYSGTHCEKNSIQIVPREENFISVVGRSINVTLDIESHHGLVKVNLSKDNKSFAIATQNNINNLVTFTIGPFLQITSGTRYYFRASPQLYPDAFFRFTFISVVVREIKLCVSLSCMTGEMCKSVGCHEKCLCTPGYYGTHCENDYLTMIPESRNYAAVVGNYLTIMLDILNYDGLVKVDVFANSINSPSIITKNYINESTAITIGPFTKNNATAKYYFRASPHMYPESYNRLTSITVVVQEAAATTEEFVQQTQSSTLAIIFVSIYGLLSTCIIVILFVRHRKKIYGKTKTELSPSGAMSYSREDKIESPYSSDNDKSDNNIFQTSSFASSATEEHQYENHPTNNRGQNSLYETVKPSTEQKNEEK